MTPMTNSTPTAALGKRAIRFAVTVVGLLLLKALFGALPMLKNASAVGSTFLSPLVLANAVADTLILAAIFTFGVAASHALREICPRAPDLSTAVQMAAVVLVLVLAYNVYQLPVACVLVSP